MFCGFYFLFLFFSTKSKKFSVKVNCPMGEQLQARPITEQDFLNLQSKFDDFGIKIVKLFFGDFFGFSPPKRSEG